MHQKTVFRQSTELLGLDTRSFLEISNFGVVKMPNFGKKKKQNLGGDFGNDQTNFRPRYKVWAYC